MKEQLVELLQQNARLTNAELAVMLGSSEAEVAAAIRELENDGVIKGYSAIVNDELANKDQVTAIIELRVTPSGTAVTRKLPTPLCSMTRWRAFP